MLRCAFVLGGPFFNLFADVIQIQKPILTETFESNRRIEAFHIRIVGRLGIKVPVTIATVDDLMRRRKARRELFAGFGPTQFTLDCSASLK